MLRLSRALVIQEIELLIDHSVGHIGRHEWSVRGVDCRRERHSYSAPAYSFDLDILNVRAKGGAEGRWELFIIGEFWRSADRASMHSPKWLKLVAGKPTDVLKWLAIFTSSRAAEATSKAHLAACAPRDPEQDALLRWRAGETRRNQRRSTALSPVRYSPSPIRRLLSRETVCL